MRRIAGGIHQGKTRRRWASGEVATTTRGEKKTGVIGKQNTGVEEHEPRNEDIASPGVE